MEGDGADLVLMTDHVGGTFNWSSLMLVSYARDRITHYSFSPVNVSGYVSEDVPRLGYPVNAVFSYRWAGLNGVGDPQGYYAGGVTTGYHDILNDTRSGEGRASSIQYSGSLLPILYGSWQNTFRYKRWELTAMIMGKFRYVFRRPSVDYDGLYRSRDMGHKDFGRRFVKDGDQKFTNIPSMPEVNDPARSLFFQYSQTLITPGDHLRLRELSISYDILRSDVKDAKLHKLTAYVYAGNLWILWRANKQGIDPDAYNFGEMPAPKIFTIGVKANL
jgi:hypothetical protein